MEESTIRGGKRGQVDTKKDRINEDITAPEVRLTGANGEQLGIVRISDAMKIAADAGFDLVEISATAKPPVCKVMNYGKFLFEKSKALKEQKKKQKQVQIKELKFRPGTDEGDYQVKLRNLRRFLEGGDKTKITLRFRGREMAHQDLGVNLLNRIKDDLADLAQCESFPTKAEGRQMVMVLAPIKK